MLKIICRLFIFSLLAGVSYPVAFASTTSELDNYLQEIADKCLSQYFPLPSWETGLVSETFILNSDGTVSQIKVIVHPTKYGTKQTWIGADKALELVVKNAAPFPKPPQYLHTPVRLVLIMDGSALDKQLKAKIRVPYMVKVLCISVFPSACPKAIV